MDSARQAASWEGKLEWGSTELGRQAFWEVGRQAFWEVGMWDGTRRRATGKDNSMAVQEGEVDRRVTGRISKDPETFKQECAITKYLNSIESKSHSSFYLCQNNL